MKLLLNILLFLIALGLVLLLLPFGILFSIIRGIYRKRPSDWWRSTNKYFFIMAYSLDIYGNVMIGPLFNSILLEYDPKYMQFGNPEETISSCLGRNQPNNLTKLGHLVANMLDFIDKDHCSKAAIAFINKTNNPWKK